MSDYPDEELEQIRKSQNFTLVGELVKETAKGKAWECPCGKRLHTEYVGQRAIKCPNCDQINVDEESRSRVDKYKEQQVEQSSFMEW